MSETQAEGGPEKTAPTPAEALESFILLTHACHQMLEASPLFAGQRLSLAAFATLAAIAPEASADGARLLARNLARGSGAEVMHTLKAAGLVDLQPREDARGRVAVPTAEGLKALADLREKLAAVASALPPQIWLAVPRYGRLVRELRQQFPAAKVSRAAAQAKSAEERRAARQAASGG
jgi:DNA-binding MarR family transcriptional regulator